MQFPRRDTRRPATLPRDIQCNPLGRQIYSQRSPEQVRVPAIGRCGNCRSRGIRCDSKARKLALGLRYRPIAGVQRRSGSPAVSFPHSTQGRSVVLLFPKLLPLVEFLLALRHADLQLGAAISEIELQWHDRESGILDLPRDLGEFLTVQQQFTTPPRCMVCPGTVEVFRDVDGFDEQFTVVELAETVYKGGLPLAQGLHLGTTEHHARLERIEDVEVVVGLPIGCYNLAFGVLGHWQ